MNTKIFFVVLSALLISSCASSQKIEKDVIYAMVYDLENNPVQDMEFYIDGKFAGKSDVYGRFFLWDMKITGSALMLSGRKNGYEEVEVETGDEAASVYYFKTATVDQLLQCSEEAFDNGKSHEALEYCSRALKIENNREDSLYLKKIIERKIQGEKNEKN